MMRWADVAAPWRAALELAWAAYAADTTPVGAVLVDATGAVVAEGANARYRPHADDPLSGSHLAHAEVAALGRLSSERGYPDLVLYSTLEPCLLCVGAAVMSSVGRVEFAGTDPYGGATAFPAGLNPHLRRGLTTFAGPRADALGTFAAALHVEFYLRRKPDGHVVAAYAERFPAIVHAGHALGRFGLHEMAAAGTPLAEAFDAALASLRRA
jgi:tRNA(Arg) A34 adenosine deaminase TadA